MNALKRKNLPNLKALEDTLIVRISKTTMRERSEKGESNSYKREGTIIYDDSSFYSPSYSCSRSPSSFLFYLGGKKKSKQGHARSIISAKAVNDKDRFSTIVDAINGNGVTIGDPYIITRKGNRYFLHVAVSKFVDKDLIEKLLEEEKKIRIVGVDVGITRLATLFCIEADREQNTYKLVNATSIDGKQFINALCKYEEEKDTECKG